MIKVDDVKKKKRMLFLVATNVVAERRPTGMPHARANLFETLVILISKWPGISRIYPPIKTTIKTCKML